MRVRVAAICLTIGGLLAGCVQKPLPVAQVAPDPFGYMKRSAVCTASPVRQEAAGRFVQMRARSDDGLCGIAISAPDGGPYASFLLTSLPLHGNSFIYNYNRQTHVTYTATTAYAGPDTFTVSLVTGAGQPRTAFKVDVSVDATGVAAPLPPLAAKPQTKQQTKTPARTHHSGHHKS